MLKCNFVLSSFQSVTYLSVVYLNVWMDTEEPTQLTTDLCKLGCRDKWQIKTLRSANPEDRLFYQQGGEIE